MFDAFKRDHPLLFWFVAAVAAALPIALWLDRPIETAFHGVFGPGMLSILNALTDFGLAGWWFTLAIVGWGLCQGLLFLAADGGRVRVWRHNARSYLYMLSALLVGGAFVQILKFIFGRYRPKLWFSDGLYGLAPFSGHDSFPSGHSQAIFTAMVALAAIHPAGHRCYLTLAFAVAISRVLIGQHYPADILAGGVLGTVSALWVKTWFEGPGKPSLALMGAAAASKAS